MHVKYLFTNRPSKQIMDKNWHNHSIAIVVHRGCVYPLFSLHVSASVHRTNKAAVPWTCIHSCIPGHLTARRF